MWHARFCGKNRGLNVRPQNLPHQRRRRMYDRKICPVVECTTAKSAIPAPSYVWERFWAEMRPGRNSAGSFRAEIWPPEIQHPEILLPEIRPGNYGQKFSRSLRAKFQPFPHGLKFSPFTCRISDFSYVLSFIAEITCSPHLSGQLN